MVLYCRLRMEMCMRKEQFFTLFMRKKIDISITAYAKVTANSASNGYLTQQTPVVIPHLHFLQQIYFCYPGFTLPIITCAGGWETLFLPSIHPPDEEIHLRSTSLYTALPKVRPTIPQHFLPVPWNATIMIIPVFIRHRRNGCGAASQ